MRNPTSSLSGFVICRVVVCMNKIETTYVIKTNGIETHVFTDKKDAIKKLNYLNVVDVYDTHRLYRRVETRIFQ